MPDYVEVALRSLFFFVFLLAVTRVLGKKQISELTFFDYAVGISIGTIAGSSSLDRALPAVDGIAALLMWGVLPFIVAMIAMKSYRFRQWVDGSPTVVVQKGQVLEQNLRKLRLTADDMMQLLREKGAFRVADVEFATMETNGELSVQKKADAQPVTPKDLGLSVQPLNDPRIVIMDGHVLPRTLRSLGKDESWLDSEIKKLGANSARDIFLGQLDTSGQLYVDLYHDVQVGASR